MRQTGPADQPSYDIITKFAKFSIVGLTGVGVNSGMLYILYQVFRLPLIPASALSVETAIISNFLLNTFWTFHERSPSIHRFARFNLISLGGMLITVATLQSLVEVAGLHYQVANLIGIALATAWNFGLNLIWTWGWD